MLVVEMKCQMCGTRFEATILDPENPAEARERGRPVRCPTCNSMQIDRMRVRQVVAREELPARRNAS